MATLSILQEQAYIVLRAFILAILPDGVEVVEAQDNRVPEPVVDDYVTMNAMARSRLATNQDSYEDVLVTASIAGTVLTVTAVAYGTLETGNQVFGPNLAASTKLGVQITGSPPGGIGTYAVTPSQTVSSQDMAAGRAKLMQETSLTVQLDFHGPNSGDNAQIFTTAFRDVYACDFFDQLNAGVSPLYGDDAKQIPFSNDQAQVEDRWVVYALMQINPVVSLPQEFAQSLAIDLIEVEATYPP